MNAIVRYQIATYSGAVTVYYDDPDISDECLIAKAKKIITKNIRYLPFGYQSFKIERED